MGLSAFFIHRPIATALLALGLFLAGLLSFVILPVSPLPRIDMPIIVVFANLPGADPETMAATVAAPLERRLGAIGGVNELLSTSSQGSTTIVIQFDLNRSVDSAGRDVQSALSASGGDLPTDMPRPPTYRKVNPDGVPIMTLAVTSKTLSPGRLYDVCDTILANRLSQIEGVAQVTVGGAEKPAVRVEADPIRAASMGLGMNDVRGTIISANVNGPKGRFDGKSLSYSINVNDQIQNPDDYKTIIVREKNGDVLRLSQIAAVSEGVEDTKRSAWRNDERGALIIIRKQADANIIETVDRIREVMPSLIKWMPPGAEITEIDDRSRTIRASLYDVEHALLVSIALVVLVVWLSLGRKTPTIAACITVPLSLAGTFAAMWALDYTLNNISLMALTVSVGFVVDDAIVMIENITRYTEKGEKNPIRASILGARQITFTVISITLSLISVFIPLFFMGGIIGRIFREFAVTLSVAIAISALISLTVTPMIYAHFTALWPEEQKKRASFGEKIMARIQHFYEKTLSVALRHQALTLIVMIGSITLTIFLYIAVPKGFLPEQDTNMISGQTIGRSDISYEAMEERQMEAIRVILADPGIASMGSFIGSGNGASSNTGRLTIALKPKDQRDASARDIINRLRPKLSAIPGLEVYLRPVQDFQPGGRDSRSSYQFVLWSESIADLRSFAPRLIEAMQKKPGFSDVTSDQEKMGQEVTIVIDRDQIARLGLDIVKIGNALQSSFAQRQISTIYTERNQYKVVLEVEKSFQLDAQALSWFYVMSPDGQAILLSTFAHFEDTAAPLSITHQGQFPSIAISYNLAGKVSLDEAMRKVEQIASDLDPPASVRLEPAGTAKFMAQTFGNQPLLILAGLLSIYIVLGVLYESLIHPLTIISTMPSAGLGALLAILAVGSELTLISIIGMILLLGIVKKNGIILVDFAIENQRLRGFSPERAIFDAARKRFRPILMTTLAAIFGAIPLAIGSGVGSELRQPLGVAVVGGLLVSQLLTLYTTPVVYLALTRLSGYKRKQNAALSLGKEKA